MLALFSSELYPTVVRGVGTGFAYVTSRLGSIAAPYVLLAGPFYSPLIFGLAAVAAGAAASALPETTGRALPETLADGEALPMNWEPCGFRAAEAACNALIRRRGPREPVVVIRE